MELLGTLKGLTFMQVHDTIFVWCLDRWVSYCSAFDWFTSVAGRYINKVYVAGYAVSLKEAA